LTTSPFWASIDPRMPGIQYPVGSGRQGSGEVGGIGRTRGGYGRIYRHFVVRSGALRSLIVA